MVLINKVALVFVLFYSAIIMVNTYIGESERAQTNVIYLLMNGFAYIVSAMEVEKEKQILEIKTF
ncbi:MAG: hypothetical protein ACO1OT_06140 [Heyndrickxia sp.]